MERRVSRGIRGLFRVVAVVVMAGCTTTQPVVPAPPVGFGARGVIALDAASIDVIDQYRPPMAKPNVEHQIPNPPAALVRQWVGERLRAVGRSGSVQVIIRDASIVEAELPRTEGFKSLFTTQQAQRYDGRIDIRIVGQAPARQFSGSAQAVASRSTTVAEDISLAGREETWNTLARQMMGDLDGRLEQGIRDGLGPMLRR